MNTTEAPALVKHNEACWVVAVFADVVVVVKVAPTQPTRHSVTVPFTSP